jgi:hypothetical protein
MAVDVPWGFIAGWGGFLAGVGGAILTGWLSQWVGLKRPPARGELGPLDPAGCPNCGRPGMRACSWCGRQHCDDHLRWRLCWASSTGEDGGFGLGQHERCRECSPNRLLVALSCLFVFGALVAMCAGVLSFPKK